MPAALEKFLPETGPAPERDPREDVLLASAARNALEGAFLALASDPDNDGDDDSSKKGDTDDDAGHTSHALFKKLRGRMGDKAAAAACARADKKVAATSQIGWALACMVQLSVTQAERDKAKAEGNSLPDGSYPIRNVKQLHSAAVLAASKHGDWKAAQALIRRRAKDFKVDVNTLPGFGSADDDGKKVAASMVALAAGSVDLGLPVALAGAPLVPLHHAPFHGQHSHPHVVPSVVDKNHWHNNDATHGVPGHHGW
jgi:hypothetical protein